MKYLMDVKNMIQKNQLHFNKIALKRKNNPAKKNLLSTVMSRHLHLSVIEVNQNQCSIFVYFHTLSFWSNRYWILTFSKEEKKAQIFLSHRESSQNNTSVRIQNKTEWLYKTYIMLRAKKKITNEKVKIELSH